MEAETRQIESRERMQGKRAKESRTELCRGLCFAVLAEVQLSRAQADTKYCFYLHSNQVYLRLLPWWWTGLKRYEIMTQYRLSLQMHERLSLNQ